MMMTVEADLFRTVMANFPAGVTIVTATTQAGEPRGLTVSAFCSVSLTPPLLLVCIDRTSNTLPAIRQSNGFTVNFLAADRTDLAMRFASKATDKFVDVAYRDPSISEGGPILEDSSAYSACKVNHSLKVGDHWIFVGEMEEGEFWEDRAPLVYCRREFAGWPPGQVPAAG
ncbi:MAG: flavin reductase [Actinobacteria bacterium]|nr:flavin reductase [Actinomycetota bacterium]